MLAKKWYVTIATAALLVVLFVAGIGAYFFIQSSKTTVRYANTGPAVRLTAPVQSGQDVPLAWQMALSATAQDAQGVAHAELWVDGILLDSQPNQGGNPNSFHYVTDWMPSSPGAHSLFVRAYSADGRVGQSNVLQYKAFVPEAGQVLASVLHETEQGETVETIAAENDVPVDDILEANPGLSAGQELPVDTSVIIPWTVPDDVDWTQFNDSLPSSNLSPSDLPPAPLELTVEELSCGKLRLSWKPGGEGIQGYRIYQLSPGAEGMVIVGEADTGRTEFKVRAPLEGLWEFYVASYTPDGKENLSQVKWNIPNCETQDKSGDGQETTDQLNTAGQAVFELTELTVTDPSFGQVYCYVRFGGSDGLYVRVPANDGEFMPRGPNGKVPIENYLSPLGVTGVSVNSVLGMDLQCWGWSGGSLYFIGVISQSHASAEWNGDELLFSTESLKGAYTLRADSLLGTLTGEKQSGNSPRGINPVMINGLYGYSFWTGSDYIQAQQVSYTTLSDYVIYKHCDTSEQKWKDALHIMQPRLFGQSAIGFTFLCADDPTPFESAAMYACSDKTSNFDVERMLTGGSNGSVLPEFADAACIRIKGEYDFEWVRCGDLKPPIGNDVAICSQPVPYPKTNTLPKGPIQSTTLTKPTNLRWATLSECVNKAKYLGQPTCLGKSKKVLVWDWDAAPEEKADFKGFRVYRRPMQVCGDYLPYGTTSEQLQTTGATITTKGDILLVAEIYGDTAQGREGILIDDELSRYFAQWEYFVEAIADNEKARSAGWLTGAPGVCDVQLQITLEGFQINGYEGELDNIFELSHMEISANDSENRLYDCSGYGDGCYTIPLVGGREYLLDQENSVYNYVPISRDNTKPTLIGLTPDNPNLEIDFYASDYDPPGSDVFCTLGMSFCPSSQDVICKASAYYSRDNIAQWVQNQGFTAILDGDGEQKGDNSCVVYIDVTVLK